MYGAYLIYAWVEYRNTAGCTMNVDLEINIIENSDLSTHLAMSPDHFTLDMSVAFEATAGH